MKRLWLFGFVAEKFRTGMRVIHESCLTVFLALLLFFWIKLDVCLISVLVFNFEENNEC